MAHRSPLLQPSHGKGGVDYYAKLYEAPLLPFEKQLIATIGATEEEYRLLVTEALKRSRVRPAGYEHIPDIQNAKSAVTAFVINLVVGITLSVVTYMLTPKPKKPQSTSRRQLDNVNQAGRFNPTFGFDSVAELGNFEDPIPIIFGKAVYEGDIYQEGGVLVSPRLVWSRMFSWGTQQSIKQLFIVGEQGYADNVPTDGILKPDLPGIFLGNNALDSIYESSFAFYWKRNNSLQVDRIKAANFHYGTRGERYSGDPQNNDDIFLCPTKEGDSNEGFSAAHSLSNNSEFGCFAPIANGTSYILNWRIFPILNVDGEDDAGNQNAYERIKLCGLLKEDGNGIDSWVAANLNDLQVVAAKDGNSSHMRDAGMAGTGRAYSRRMGIVKLKRGSTEYTVPNVEKTKVMNAVKDDEITFKIAPGGADNKIPKDFYNNGKVKVDDINSIIDEMNEAADDQLQLGELFQIGRTYWQVIKRNNDGNQPRWFADKPHAQYITLKCIDTDETEGTSDEIGLVSEEIVNPTAHYHGDRPHVDNLPGTGFFPLMRHSQAVIRTTRACEVVEIGIRSRVYQQLNGLANLQTIPAPTGHNIGSLASLEADRVSVQIGTVSAYIKRASSFVILVRKAGKDSAGELHKWKQLGLTFVVIGSRAIDIYNWIRIKNPERGLYEYQIKPKSGANLHRNPDDKEFISLRASADDDALIEKNTDIPGLGTFTVTTRGETIQKKEFKTNKEFMTNPVITGSSRGKAKPSAVSIDDKYPINDGLKVKRITGLKFIENDGIPAQDADPPRPGGRHGAFFWEIFGSAASSSVPTNGITSKWVKESVAGKELNIKYVVKKIASPGHFSGESHRWACDSNEYPDTGYFVRPPGGEWNVNDRLTICRTLSGSNPYKARTSYPDLTQACVTLEVTSITEDDHVLGKAHALRWEVFGDPGSLSVGYTKTVTITDLTGLKLKMTSTVFAHDQVIWPGVANSWTAESDITVVNDSDTTASWVEGDTVDYKKTVSASNPFRVAGTQVGYKFKINQLDLTTIVEHSEAADRVFEGQSQYADLSLYGDSLVQKSNLSGPEHTVAYVNEMVSNGDNNVPNYDKMTIAGLSLKAGRNFNQIDQIRTWLKEGLHVKNLHPDDGSAIGPSNLYTDLVYYLLSDETAGAGRVLDVHDRGGAGGSPPPTTDELIDTADLANTAKFLRTNKLFCNGVITSPTSVRSFISETAPLFMCDAVLKDGRFSVRPALPTTSSGEIDSTGAVEIKQLFTTGNIIEDSFETNYLSGEERRPFRAVMRYRHEAENALPAEKTLELSLTRNKSFEADLSIETFDLTAFCTTEHHAKLVGKYFLSLRDRVTHTVSFSTTPHGLDLAPGDYIKVVTETTPYSPAANGSINGSGVITSASTIANGSHTVLYYLTASDDEVKTGTMHVSDGVVSDSAFHNSIFTLQVTTASQNVYRVETITLGEDMIVQITASEFPCTDSFVSRIAQDVNDKDDDLYLLHT